MRTPRYPVLLHGFTGSGEAWRGILDGLSAAGHAPVLHDLPGHGRHAGATDPAAFTLEAALEGIAAAGRWPADLVGYSMGGRIALHFACAFPDRVRRLVLESASPGIEDDGERAGRRRQDEDLATRIVERGIEAFVEEWEALPLFETQLRLDPEALSRQRARRLGNAPRSLACALRGLGAGALPPLWREIRSLRVPTLLLVGEEDRKFAALAARMADALPEARVVVVPGAGHAVHLERPASWLEAVTAFLAD